MSITKSLIIPCKDEGPNFLKIYNGFKEKISKNTEIIIVLDSDKDSTFPAINTKLDDNSRILFSNTVGPAAAVKYGIENSNGQMVCIAMGDGSDDPNQVEELFSLLEYGADIAVGSRYSKGGKYDGKKNLKWLLSRSAGFFLYHFFRIGTKDPTNMFKAYSREFLNEVYIESNNGFTLGLEMIVKGKLNNKKIKEIPTIWTDRTFGESKFNLRKFIPSYVYWVRRLLFIKK